MQAEMKQVEQRVKGYWYQDGLGEMAGGLVFLVLGLYFGLAEYLSDTDWGGKLQAGMLLVLLTLIYAGRWLIRSLKSLFVYPRTGSVEYHINADDKHQRKIFAAVLAALMAGLFVLLVKMSDSQNLIISLTGLVVGVALIFFQSKASGLGRFYVLGMISVILGLSLSLTQLTTGYALGLYYGLQALVFFVSGAFVLSKYLRENPTPVEAPRE